ncbi:MAG: ribosome maturation factor RimP [Nitrospiria bacterium]
MVSERTDRIEGQEEPSLEEIIFLNMASKHLPYASPLERVKEVVKPILRSLGLELFEVAYSGPMKGGHLKVTIDKKEGVSVEDCAKASRYLSPALEIEEGVPVDFTLEVSSPGLQRPLRGKSDFYRFLGSRVRIETGLNWPDRKVVIGRLLDFNGDTLIVSTDDEEGEREIPFEWVSKARLEIDLAFSKNKGGLRK